MTDASAPQPAPDPGRIIGLMTGFEQTAALLGAIQIGLFSAIAGGAETVEALSQVCSAAPRGVRILADVMTVYGLLTKAGDRYALSADAALYLNEASPAYIGAAARFLASADKIALYFGDTEGWARRGGPSGLANTTPESQVWVEFAAGMSNFMAPTAQSLARTLSAKGPAPKRVLDIAAGHGLFGIEVAKAFPSAYITALDWENVLTVAESAADVHGVADRYTKRPGSAFEAELGGPYDLILIPNFLHHFDPPTCVAFLVRVANALEPERGRTAIVEYTPDESRVAPPVPALFALAMLTGTPDGDAYTAREIGAMCTQAGLSEIAVEPLTGTAQTPKPQNP